MPYIKGARVLLREYRESDFDNIREWVNDPEVTKNLSPLFDRLHTAPMTRSFLQQVLDNKLEGHFFVVTDAADPDRFLGQFDLRTGRDASHQATLAIIIPDPGLRGRGYGRETMELGMRFGFLTLNLHKICLQVLSRNEPAITLYRSLGFVEEGRLREDVYRDGEYLDLVQMSILRREWEGMQQRPDQEQPPHQH